MSASAIVQPAVSFVISTFNRREILLRTLGELEHCGLDSARFEILVVDNASHDDTAAAIAERFPHVRVFKLTANRGSCAKNIAIGHARGQFIVFLDDDSYPMPGSMARMFEHFSMDPELGAAVFTVTLPDGSRECSAYPDVFIGCGTAFRREALDEVGLLPEDFFMQAEEYDLSLRLLQAGWEIRTFGDLHVAHLKTPNARRSWRTMRLDVRNNFVVATRYFPREWMPRFTFDWMKRYRDIAAAKQQRSAFWIGLAQGAVANLRPGSRRPITPDVFERFTRINQIEQSLREAVNVHAIRSVLFIDYGKNILPYWLAAQNLDLTIVAIADGRMPSGTRYRGIPIVNDSVARRLDFDAAIVSNSSPVHAQNRAQLWRTLDPRPVLELIDYTPATKRTGLAA